MLHSRRKYQILCNKSHYSTQVKYIIKKKEKSYQ